MQEKKKPGTIFVSINTKPQFVLFFYRYVLNCEMRLWGRGKTTSRILSLIIHFKGLKAIITKLINFFKHYRNSPLSF